MLLLALRALLAFFSAAVCDMVGGRSRDRASSSNACLVPEFEAFCGRVDVVELELGQLGQLICLTPSSLKRTRQEGSKTMEKDTGTRKNPRTQETSSSSVDYRAVKRRINRCAGAIVFV